MHARPTGSTRATAHLPPSHAVPRRAAQDSFVPPPSFEEEQAAYNALSTTVGHVILNHDTVQATAEQLVPFIISWVRQRGLKAVTMGACLGLPEGSWYTDVTAPGTRDDSWTCA